MNERRKKRGELRKKMQKGRIKEEKRGEMRIKKKRKKKKLQGKPIKKRVGLQSSLER